MHPKGAVIEISSFKKTRRKSSINSSHFLAFLQPCSREDSLFQCGKNLFCAAKDTPRSEKPVPVSSIVTAKKSSLSVCEGGISGSNACW